MKMLLPVILMFQFVCLQSQASVKPQEEARSFAFKFSKFQGETYEYEIKTSDKTEAFEKAAQACFEHFKAGRHISMEFGQDIIDVCVNPRPSI